LIDWLMIKFKFTPEQAHFGLIEWAGQEYKAHVLSLSKDYQMKLDDINKDYHDRLIELADWRESITPSRLRTD
jgi:hypothetical protein